MNEHAFDLAVPLDDFEGDPLTTEDAYLRDDEFADQVLKLEPDWARMRSGVTAQLRLFDECGLLRPKLRIELPRDYAIYDAQRGRQKVHTPVSDVAFQQFDTIREVLWTRRRHFEDPVRRHPLEGRAELAPYLGMGSSAPNIEKWEVHVADMLAHEGVSTAV
jgi:hypothetical protein